MITPEKIDHTYHVHEDHSVTADDYLPETINAVERHDEAYQQDPLSYFENLTKRNLNTRIETPFIRFSGKDISDTDLVVVQLPFANRVIPANSPETIAAYATSNVDKLPRGIYPNSFSQALKHSLAHTAIMSVESAYDEKGRPPALAVVSSPSSDFLKSPLSRVERKQMRNGDLSPYANVLAEIAEESGAKNIYLSGYSFGAAVATRAATLDRIKKNFDVKGLIIGEPTTYRDRSTARVMLDYTLFDAFKESSGDQELTTEPETNWLNDAQKARKDIERNGDGPWLDNLYGNGNIRTQLQIARSLGKITLHGNITEVMNAGIPTTVLYAADSLMTRDFESMFVSPITDLYTASKQRNRLQIMKVKPVGEVAAKHIVGEIPMLYADYMTRGLMQSTNHK